MFASSSESNLLVGEHLTSRNDLASHVLVAIVTIAPMLSASDPATTKNALKLVAQAAQAEIDGDLLSRERFLNEAKQSDPNYAPANGLRGKAIGSDRSWGSLDQAIEQAKSDKLLANYEAMRAEQPPTIQGNLQAAVWCAKNTLPLQCRAHIENVPRGRGHCKRPGTQHFHRGTRHRADLPPGTQHF